MPNNSPRTAPRSVLLTLTLLSAAAPMQTAAGDPLPGSSTLDARLELSAEGRPFYAIHRAPQRERRGAVVLLHDQGTGADSHEVIRPLRLGLAAAGWETLSLALPAARRDEGRRQWLERTAAISARLQAGLAWLRQQAPGPPAVIALGDSGAPVLEFATGRTDGELLALVLISPVLETGQAVDGLAALGRLRLPVLDLYAERDSAGVTGNAGARRAAAADNVDYRQQAVPGAVAGFRGLEDGLVAAVRAWLAGRESRSE